MPEFSGGEIYLSDTLDSKLQQASRYSALGTLSNYLNELNHVTAVHKGSLLPLRPDSGLIEVLWPPPAMDTKQLNTNDCSLVLRVLDNKRSFLLTGDIGDIPQKQIRSTAEVLLLPHHGSANTGLPEFVESVGPQCIVNSCGFLESRRLKKLDQTLPNRKIWHTFQSGCISVFPDSHTIKVMPFRDTDNMARDSAKSAKNIVLFVLSCIRRFVDNRKIWKSHNQERSLQMKTSFTLDNC